MLGDGPSADVDLRVGGDVPGECAPFALFRSAYADRLVGNGLVLPEANVYVVRREV